MTVSIERRDGRITESEYRAVVAAGDKSAAGPWCFSKANARTHVEALRRSLFDADAAVARLAAGSAERCRRIRTRLETDRRVAP